MPKPSRQSRAARPAAPPPMPALVTAPVAPAADVAMPTAENAPPCAFTPGPGIAAADVFEITLLFLLHLTGSPVGVDKGALRTIAVPGFRVEQLSDSARRFMTPLNPG